eukprot:gene31088-6215_t
MEGDKSLLFTSLVIAKLFSADSIKSAIAFGAKHAGYEDGEVVDSTIAAAFKIVAESTAIAAPAPADASVPGAKKKKVEKVDRKPRQINAYAIFLHLFGTELHTQWEAHPEKKPVKVEGEKGDSPLILASKAWAQVAEPDKVRLATIFTTLCEEANAQSKSDGLKTDLGKIIQEAPLSSADNTWVKTLIRRMFTTVSASLGLAPGSAIKQAGEDGSDNEAAAVPVAVPAAKGKKAAAAAAAPTAPASEPRAKKAKKEKAAAAPAAEEPKADKDKKKEKVEKKKRKGQE